MFNNEFNTQVENATWAISNRLKTNGIMPSTENVVASAYLLYLCAKQNYAFKTLNEIIASDSLASQKKYFLMNYIHDKIWQVIFPLTTDYSVSVFKEIVLNYENQNRTQPDTSTPISLVKLANKILNINNNEVVADVCSGNGTFLLNSATSTPTAHYYGYDIAASCKDITDIRANLLNTKMETETIDVFELPKRLQLNHSFDKLFSNYPFGIRVSGMLQCAKEFIDTLTDVNPYIFPGTSSDWIYNSLLLHLMNENGKAIAIMTNGACFNSIDLQARRYFIDNGFVEAVISLPNALFNSTSIPVTMIVLSNFNRTVRMIDATKMFTKGRRTNELSDKNIKNILFAYNNDTENSISISNDELKINEYALSPQRYLAYNIPEEDQENYIAFKHVIKQIKRGAPIRASDLDNLASEEETNIKYLRLQDIKDGIISDELNCLKELEPRHSAYLLKDKDLILGKIGFPYKVAVAQITQEQSIIPVGNMYAIELDTTKINPYYIKAFFESEQGAAALKSITTGVTIPIISVDRLKNLHVPVPSIKKQNKIANEYLAVLDEIQVLKLKLQKATNRLGHVFDSVKEGI